MQMIISNYNRRLFHWSFDMYKRIYWNKDLHRRKSFSDPINAINTLLVFHIFCNYNKISKLHLGKCIAIVQTFSAITTNIWTIISNLTDDHFPTLDTEHRFELTLDIFVEKTLSLALANEIASDHCIFAIHFLYSKYKALRYDFCWKLESKCLCFDYRCFEILNKQMTQK